MKMKWISVKEKLPETHIIAYVMNERHGMDLIALYHPDYNIWKLKNHPGCFRDSICLDVTHYVELPVPFLEPEE